MKATSIIIPTLNEAGNIVPLIDRIFSVLQKNSIVGEIVVVDDGSSDGTREQVTDLSTRYPVRLICRDDRQGLASAVIEGAQKAEYETVIVMDGDLSHAPKDIPRLLNPLISGECDVSIGSRYTSGGKTSGWPLKRKIASKLASFPAQVLTGVADPLSGFFGVARSKLLALRPDVQGYKICLELLLSQVENLKVVEIPISFRDRSAGSTKMTTAVIKSYFFQLLNFCGISFTATFWSLFARLFPLCALTDALIYYVCNSVGLTTYSSHFMALVGSVSLACLGVGFPHPDKYGQTRLLDWPSLMLWVLFLFIYRTGIFVFAQSSMWEHTWTWLSAALAITFSSAATAIYFTVSASTQQQRPGPINQGLRSRLVLIGIIFTSLSFRLLFGGAFELLQEEAYYWNYAQHPDIGYLDHPPMVAILIKLGTTVFGNSEFGVRVGALFCWVVATTFIYLYARDISTRDNALRAAAVMSVLPAFFVFGLVLTPDAPMIACWAGALFFSRRALLDADTKSWLGVGLFLGLGLFSKYTIALLGLAIFVFLIVDSSSRRQLLKPYPYIAAAIALLVFSPVIVWNIQHDWASFLFQTHDRIVSSSEFSAHELLASIIILITPVGFLAVLAFFFCRKQFVNSKLFTKAHYSFAFITAIVPLAIFFIFSLTREVKLNWTSPIWLVLIPFMAVTLSRESRIFKTQYRRRFFRSWRATILIFLLVYGGLLQYFTMGLPGVPYPSDGPLWGWRGIANQVDTLVQSIEQESGKRPLVVGMDQYKTASGMAFYRTLLFEEKNNVGRINPLAETQGRSVLGREAVMYGYWFSSLQNKDMPLLVLSPDLADLDKKWIRIKSRNISATRSLRRLKNNREIAPLYYRIINTTEPNDTMASLSRPAIDG